MGDVIPFPRHSCGERLRHPMQGPHELQVATLVFDIALFVEKWMEQEELTDALSNELVRAGLTIVQESSVDCHAWLSHMADEFDPRDAGNGLD